MKKLFWMAEEENDKCCDLWCSKPSFKFSDVMDEIHQQVIHTTDAEMKHVVGYVINRYAVNGDEDATAEELFYENDEWIDDDSIVEQIVYRKPDNPTYREYYELHYDENPSWCCPMTDGNGRYAIWNDGEIICISTEECEVESWEKNFAEEFSAFVDDLRREYDDDDDDVSGETIVERYLDHEDGCANCPFNHYCELMEKRVHGDNRDVEKWDRTEWKKG